jgi:hypothetical protein
MPPKKKAATKRKAPAKKTPAGGKKAKKEEPEEPTVSDIVSTLKAAGAGIKKTHKVDEQCYLKSSAQVMFEYWHLVKANVDFSHY